MSWGINPNATEKEKIFAEFNDSINGLNCADGLSYRHYSAIYDLGRKLADDEYNQGRADERAKVIDEFLEEAFREIEQRITDGKKEKDVYLDKWDLRCIAKRVKEQKNEWIFIS